MESVLYLSVPHFQEATRIGILVANRHSPIIQMPPEYMWPLASIISFPTAVQGLSVVVISSNTVTMMSLIVLQELLDHRYGHCSVDSSLKLSG